MENVKVDVKKNCRRRATACFLTCSLVLNALLPVALALGPGDLDPLSPATGVLGTTWGDHTIIDTDHGAIIDWSNFDTGGTQSVAFNQFLGGDLSSASAVLNRISSASATQFDGALIGNGRVFVVNPAGIVFGAGSSVNVAQLVASGLNMSNDAFNTVLADPANRMEFEGGDGDVTNLGIINAGSVYLIGKNVINANTIIAPGGLIVLAAGDNVYLAQNGTNVVVDVSDAGDGIDDVINSSQISAENGSIVLAAGDTFSRAVSNSGLVTAGGGTVRFRAARIENSGTIRADGIDGGDAGSVTLSGIDEVIFSHTLTDPPTVTADGGADGDGGSITLESGGTVTLEQSIVSATGGSDSGDGGYIKITGEHFSIAPGSDIDASPQNLDYEPGTLEIDPQIVTVANGANLGVTDTIYEEDIETLSNNGTNVIIRADDTVIVEDIADDEIEARYGDIELHATGAAGSVSFADTGDTISTTLGDIAISAGSGGINIGSLETGKDLSDSKPTPGKITLETSDGGDIAVQNLAVRTGWGIAEITADASGDLTVNGDVAVGRDGSIHNVPNGTNGEALANLSAGDNVIINGNVTADTHGIHDALEGGVTKSYIGIFGGTNSAGDGDVTINGDLVARAKSASNGTSEATIEVGVWGNIIFGPDAAMPVADGDNGKVHVESFGPAEDISPTGDVARIIIDQAITQALPDFDETHMGSPLAGNVLDNDADPQDDPITAALDGGPSHAASFTLNPDGSYSYTPEAGYVGDDTFTYTATADGDTTAPVLVTITMTNTLPTAAGEAATTHMGVAVGGTIQDNISDADGDPLATALVTDAANGVLTLNPDGSYSYEPDAGYVGGDSFTYSVADPEIGAAPAQAIVIIDVTNALPVLNNDAATTNESTNVGGNVLANDLDADGDPLTAALVDGPSNAGSFTLNPDGSFSYMPADGFVGEDSFTYSASDPEISATPGQATVTIVVNSHGSPPPTPPAPAPPSLQTAPPAAPGVDVRTEPKVSGYPALVKWVAEEIGVDERVIDIWFANTLASARDIPPYYAYSSFKKAASVLQDPRGEYADALVQVVTEFASSAAPVTEEQMASIAKAIALAPNVETGNIYALAGSYLDSVVDYVAFLVHEMGFSEEDAIEFVTTKYVDQLTEKENVLLAVSVTVRMRNLYLEESL